MTKRDASPAAQPLFRSEVIAAQQTQWLGTVLLTPPISYWFFVVFAVVTGAAILGLLFFADYTRKERIHGWLVPQQGLVRIFAPQPGVITQLYVQDDTEVQKGAPLLVVSTELRSEAFGATQEEVVRRLTSRRNSLATERDLRDELFAQREQGLSRQITAFQGEQAHREQELEVQRQRVKLLEDSAVRLKPLRERGLLTDQRWIQIEDDRLDHVLRLRALERDIAATQRARLALQAELKALPLEKETELAKIDRGIDALEQELAQAEARRQIVLSAPQTGTVTAVQAEQGSGVNTTVPLLSIIPAGAELEARLFIPSRAIGFIRPGQPVLLRYRAFPYQKFGHYEGTIANVSRSTLTPSELSPQLRGIASVQGTDEPVYPVTVSLARQSANAYGTAIALQPGMQLEADVLIESRRLIEWVLDPLFTLTGTWRG